MGLATPCVVVPVGYTMGSLVPVTSVVDVAGEDYVP